MMKLLTSLVLVLAACTGSSEDASSPACQAATSHSDFAWIQTNVFDTSCVLSGCHMGAAANAGHLNLADGMSYNELVDEPSQVQEGWKRVVPGDPSSSYLMVALGHESGPMPPDGYMPLSSPALCSEKIDAIERWISAGAQQQ
jgi:ABC-type Fe3+-hydroxamate transport system substrate-binding protein